MDEISLLQWCFFHQRPLKTIKPFKYRLIDLVADEFMDILELAKDKTVQLPKSFLLFYKFLEDFFTRQLVELTQIALDSVGSAELKER